jgi:hypothetical protein
MLGSALPCMHPSVQPSHHAQNNFPSEPNPNGYGCIACMCPCMRPCTQVHCAAGPSSAAQGSDARLRQCRRDIHRGCHALLPGELHHPRRTMVSQLSTIFVPSPLPHTTPLSPLLCYALSTHFFHRTLSNCFLSPHHAIAGTATATACRSPMSPQSWKATPLPMGTCLGA